MDANESSSLQGTPDPLRTVKHTVIRFRASLHLWPFVISVSASGLNSYSYNVSVYGLVRVTSPTAERALSALYCGALLYFVVIVACVVDRTGERSTLVARRGTLRYDLR